MFDYPKKQTCLVELRQQHDACNLVACLRKKAQAKALLYDSPIRGVKRSGRLHSVEVAER